MLNALSLPTIRSIFHKEMTQLLRDPYLVAFIIALPLLQLLVTGLAIEKELRHVPTVVYNYDNRNGSVELLKTLNSSNYFEVVQPPEIRSEDDLVQSVRRGKYRLGIVIPPDYSERLLAGSEPAQVNLILDGSNANISKMLLNAARAILANHAAGYASSHVLSTHLGGGLGSPPILLNTKVLYNPELQSAFFLIPGVLAIVMHMMTVLFTSFSIVRERETGTLEQLMVTPIRVTDLMVGKVVPYAVIGFLDMILTLGVMVWFFNIAITGSFWFLCIASIIFIFTSLGVGLLISTTCRSQVQAIQLTVGILLPTLLLSGFVFPIEPMPWFIKVLSYSLPVTYYLEIIRGIVMKGIGPAELWLPTLVLMAYTTLTIGFSILRFKKQVA